MTAPPPVTWTDDPQPPVTFSDVLPTSLTLSWEQFTTDDPTFADWEPLYTKVVFFTGDINPGYPWLGNTDGEKSTPTSGLSPIVTDTSRDIVSLNPGVLYQYAAYTQWWWNNSAAGGISYQTSTLSDFCSIATPTGAWIRDEGVWKVCTPYLRVDGVWKMVLPHVRNGGIWNSTD